MKKSYILTFTFIVLILSGLKAQKNEFKTLKSSGTVPRDFLTLSSHDFNEAAETQIKKSDRRRTAKYKESFLEKSNFYINRLLRSGSILFNDSITNYVRDVADVVLKDFPEIRDEIRFYTAKHSSVNAFSTDAGIIIFNTGLLAQLENEAQLAFVIAHEVVHFYKKHGITGYIEEKMVSEEISEMDSWATTERFYLAKNSRSREMETEADETGFKKFFASSGYELEAALGVMDVLQYAYLPFNEIKFSTSFLTNQYFTIPEEYLLEELSTISIGDDYDDDMSSHPSVRKRRDKLADLIRLEKGEKGKRFIVSENRFQRMRKLARYETIRKHMIERDYPRAIYDSYVMMQDNPNDRFLQKVVAGALYGVSMYKSKHTDRPVISDYDDIEGESQQVYFILDEMSDEWANVVALQYAWRVFKLHPDDKYLQKITDQLMLNMVEEEKMHLSDFYDRSREDIMAERDSLEQVETEEEKEDEPQSKYDRIREKSKESQLTRGEEAYRFAFVDMLNDKTFRDGFDKAEEIAKENDEEDDVSYDDFRQELNEAKKEKQASKLGHKVGVSKVFMIDPLFLKFDERKDEEIKFFKTEQLQQVMSDMIQQTSTSVGLQAVMMDPWDLAVDDVDRYNDIAILKDWMTEFYNHDDLKIVPFAANDAYAVMDEYNIRYLNWVGVVSGRVKDPGKALRGCLYFSIGLFPLAIYEVAKPEYQMILVNSLIDLEESEIRFSYRYITDKRAGKYRMQMRLYDVLNQLRTEE